MTDKPDRALEEFLDGESKVSRAYAELRHEQPPEALDAAILAAARDELAREEDPTVIRVRRWHRWSVPAALAATVIVAVPLVVRVVDLTAPQPVADSRAGADHALRATPEADAMRNEAEPVARLERQSGAPATGARTAATSVEALEDAAAQSPPPVFDADPQRLVESVTGYAPGASEYAPGITPSDGDERNRNQGAESVAGPWTAGDAANGTRSGPNAGDRDRIADAVAGDAARKSDDAPTATRPDRNAADTKPDADASARYARDQTPEPAATAERLRRAAEARASGRPIPAPATDPEPPLRQSAKPVREAAPLEHLSVDRSLATTGDDTLANRDTALAEVIVVTGSRGTTDYLEPQRFIERIEELHALGQIRAARVQLGELLVRHPDVRLPAGFPLERSEAIAPQRRIVSEADEWLGEIAGLAVDGDIDSARQELAGFLEDFPDYELPGWFPLTRDDAAAIEP